MTVFNKNRLQLIFQSVAGPRTWEYSDTGLLIADVQEVSGFFTTGRDCGMRHGDRVFITEGDTGLFVNTANGVAGGENLGGRRQYCGTVFSHTDTGGTQVTLGQVVLIGDTS
jgi:hypothetical protein